MKKSLTILSLTLTSVAIASAQTINIGQNAAQGQVNGSAITGLITLASTIMGMLAPLAVTAATLGFFWFLIKFITNGDAPDKKQEALKGIGYSVLALFIMVSIWGIIGFMGSIVGVGQGGNIPVPGVPVLNNQSSGGNGGVQLNVDIND